MSAVVDVVFPCLDEAAALPDVLARLPTGFRAIVVDNGSTDGSGDVAAAHGALVIVEPRRGFGAAAHAGLLAADAPIVAFCDADGSFDSAELSRVTAPIAAEEADLVLGRRRPESFGAWPLHARTANAYLAHRLRRISRARLHDLGPMRAARREPWSLSRSPTGAAATPSRWCSPPRVRAGASARSTSRTGPASGGRR
ncbi:MAG: glycosyltransferase family 2 protein [Microbacterium sp.]